MLRCVRLGWEQQAIRPYWIHQEVFVELLIYWDSDIFKAKCEMAKKFRAFEVGVTLI